MMDEKKKAEGTRKEHYHKAPNFLSVYANSARLLVSPWDFRFIFGEIEEATGECLDIREDVRVTMSPEHAKAVFQMLERNIRQYEEKFGEIKQPLKAGGAMIREA